MLHFPVEKKTEFTYSLLKVCVYFMNKISDLTNDMQFFSDILLKIKTSLVDVILEIQSTLVISTSVISNNRLSRTENLIPVLT